jgi:hypothetical protein
MKTIKQRISEILVKTILDGGERIERAVDDGPRATVAAIDDLIAELSYQADAIAITVALGCGNPDCPNCGQAARDPAPVTTPAPLN